jgi:hypothetical protein
MHLLTLTPPQVREALLKNIKRRMTPQPLKIRAGEVQLEAVMLESVDGDSLKGHRALGAACPASARPSS